MALFQTNKAPCCLACKIRARRAAAALQQTNNASSSSGTPQPAPAVDEDECVPVFNRERLSRQPSADSSPHLTYACPLFRTGLPRYTADRPPAYTPRRIVVRTTVNGGSSTRLTFATVDTNPAPPPDYMDLHAQLTAKCSYTGPGVRLGGSGR